MAFESYDNVAAFHILSNCMVVLLVGSIFLEAFWH